MTEDNREEPKVTWEQREITKKDELETLEKILAAKRRKYKDELINTRNLKFSNEIDYAFGALRAMVHSLEVGLVRAAESGKFEAGTTGSARHTLRRSTISRKKSCSLITSSRSSGS